MTPDEDIFEAFLAGDSASRQCSRGAVKHSSELSELCALKSGAEVSLGPV